MPKPLYELHAKTKDGTNFKFPSFDGTKEFEKPRAKFAAVWESKLSGQEGEPGSIQFDEGVLKAILKHGLSNFWINVEKPFEARQGQFAPKNRPAKPQGKRPAAPKTANDSEDMFD